MSIFLKIMPGSKSKKVQQVLDYVFLWYMLIFESLDHFWIFDFWTLCPKQYSDYSLFFETPFRFLGFRTFIVFTKLKLYHNLMPLRSILRAPEHKMPGREQTPPSMKICPLCNEVANKDLFMPCLPCRPMSPPGSFFWRHL